MQFFKGYFFLFLEVMIRGLKIRCENLSLIATCKTEQVGCVLPSRHDFLACTNHCVLCVGFIKGQFNAQRPQTSIFEQ